MLPTGTSALAIKRNLEFKQRNSTVTGCDTSMA
jgi:hypothetical protein